MPTTEDRETEFFYASESDPRRYYDHDEEGIVKGGGPYFDEVERERAEIQRAKVEGREPDLENPPATVGTPLLTMSKLNPDLHVTPGQQPAATYTTPVTVPDDPNPFPTQPAEDPNAYPDYATYHLGKQQELQSSDTGSDSEEPITTSDTSDKREYPDNPNATSE